MATALVLTSTKLGAWALTGSTAILASLIDSAMDTIASGLTLFAVRLSLKPADDDHRFGHGKSEALAGLAQALLITVSVVLVVMHAIDRLLYPKPLTSIPAGLAVMLLSIVATLALVLYQRRIVRLTGSDAIAGDALHYASDLATNASTIVALLLASYGFPQLDALFAIGIAVITLYGALRIGSSTLEVLMDRELPAAVQERIRNIALSHLEVRGIHDLRTRQSGATKLIQMHIEMDGRISLTDAHRIAEDVERVLREAFPGADVVIHQDPAGIVEKRLFS